MRIMSFNLRFHNDKDGENSWPHRVDAVMKLWKDTDADIVGVQEALPSMMSTLTKRLSGYKWIGRGRNGGGDGEFSAVFYKADVLTPVEHGFFWLSDTPHLPGSRSFGNQVIRMATWARMQLNDGTPLFFLNTHLDHAVEEARVKGARQIVDFLAEHAAGDPVIVTGDFNAEPESVAIQTLMSNGYTDALQQAGDTGLTFHGFSDQPTSRIDYIFYRGEQIVLEGGRVISEKVDGRYPSDHYPVYADLTFAK